MRAASIVLLCAAALAAAGAHAQWRAWDADFDENEKPWKEIEAKIPAYPRPGDLLRFEAGGASPHGFFIDARSLSIGEDGVVRYTLVVRTSGGATNVSYEGIRCDAREQKVYAFGHAGGAWTRARNPQWRRIEYQEVNRHHAVLYTDFLCEGSSNRYPYKTTAEIVRRLKYGAAPPSHLQY